MKRFHDSIRRVGKMSKREVVLDMMRIAGFEGDDAKFVRLLIENPISRKAAKEAWAIGCKQRALLIVGNPADKNSFGASK